MKFVILFVVILAVQGILAEAPSANATATNTTTPAGAHNQTVTGQKLLAEHANGTSAAGNGTLPGAAGRNSTVPATGTNSTASAGNATAPATK